MQTKKLIAGLTMAACLGLAAQAHAGYLPTILVPGTLNTFRDQSREAFFDANPDGVFGAGDVLVGFVRIDNRTAPAPGIAINNRVYGIFSQQVLSVVANGTGSTVFFVPTTVPGLRLSDIVPSALATDMIAVYSSFTPYVDLITTSPISTVGGPAVTLADYLNHIKTAPGSQLDLRAGLTDPIFCTGGSGDCFAASTPTAPGAITTGLIATAPSSITFANFVAGLEVSFDPPGFTMTDAVTAGLFPFPAALTTTAELAISNGGASGAFGENNYLEWTNGSELAPGVAQCGGPCGFSDKADFSVIPVAVVVPEPSALFLLGIGLIGLGAARGLRRRQS